MEKRVNGSNEPPPPLDYARARRTKAQWLRTLLIVLAVLLMLGYLAFWACLVTFTSGW
jgi:hypothetical protein